MQVIYFRIAYLLIKTLKARCFPLNTTLVAFSKVVDGCMGTWMTKSPLCRKPSVPHEFWGQLGPCRLSYSPEVPSVLDHPSSREVWGRGTQNRFAGTCSSDPNTTDEHHKEQKSNDMYPVFPKPLCKSIFFPISSGK